MATGYIYYVSLTGVTGAANLDLQQVTARLPQIRSHIRLPVGVGFGIRDAQTARAIAAISDAVVIGSRLVQEIESSAPDQVLGNLSTLLGGIRRAMDGA
jgi:tryptophan synthase alpha chain